MIKLICIVVVILLAVPSFAQKNRKKSKEESFIEQAKDDFLVLSEEQFPYIEKFHLAVREMLSGNLPEAKKLFKECLQDYPHDDAVYFGLAEVAKRQKLTNEALKYFEKALEIDPNNIHYRQETAFLQFDKAEFDKAAENLKIMVEQEPRHVEWLYAYAQTLLYIRDYKKALEVFDKFQDQMGPIPEITMIKLDLLKETKQDHRIEEELLLLKKAHPNNLDVLKTIIGYYEDNNQQEEAIKLIEELVEAEPENGIAHFILAKYYLDQNQLDKYLESLLVVAKSTEIKVVDKLTLSQPLFSMDESMDESMLLFSEGLQEAHPGNIKALSLHAEVLSNLGKTKEARDVYRSALEIDQTEFRLWTSVLAFESAHRDYQALYEDAQKAMLYFPSIPFIYYAAAEGAMYLKRYDEALEFLEAGSMFIIDDAVQEGRFAMRYGEIFFRQNKIKEALKAFEIAFKREDSEQVLLSYAYHAALAGHEVQKAVEIVEKVLKESDPKSTAYYVSAFVYIKAGKLLEAKELLLQGIAETRHKVNLYDLLGDVYILQKEEAKAIEAWEKAVKLESRNQSIGKKIKEKKYYEPTYQ